MVTAAPMYHFKAIGRHAEPRSTGPIMFSLNVVFLLLFENWYSHVLTRGVASLCARGGVGTGGSLSLPHCNARLAAVPDGVD